MLSKFCVVISLKRDKKQRKKKRDRNYTDAQENHSFQFHLGFDQLAYSLESLCNFSKYITQVIVIYMKTVQKHHKL